MSASGPKATHPDNHIWSREKFLVYDSRGVFSVCKGNSAFFWTSKLPLLFWGVFPLVFFFFSISHTYYARKIMIFCIRNQNLGNLTPISAYMQNETHCRLSSGLFCLSAAWDWVSWDLLQWFQWVTWHSSFGRYYELALILGLTAI